MVQYNYGGDEILITTNTEITYFVERDGRVSKIVENSPVEVGSGGKLLGAKEGLRLFFKTNGSDSDVKEAKDVVPQSALPAYVGLVATSPVNMVLV